MSSEASDIITDMTEWTELKESIEVMQTVALGEGMHFDSLEEARRFRDPRPARRFGCGGVHSGEMCNTRAVFIRWHLTALQED